MNLKQALLALIQTETNPIKKYFFDYVAKDYPKERTIDEDWEIYMKAKSLMSKRQAVGKEIRYKIEEIRVLLDCSFEEVLDYVGITQNELRLFEKGTLCISKKRCEKINEATKGMIPLEILFTFVDIKDKRDKSTDEHA